MTATSTTQRQYQVQERKYVSSERESLKNRGTGREGEMGREGGMEGEMLIERERREEGEIEGQCTNNNKVFMGEI